MGTLWKTQNWNILYWETKLNFYIYTSDIWVFHKFKPLKWFRFYKVGWEWELFLSDWSQKAHWLPKQWCQEGIRCRQLGEAVLNASLNFSSFPTETCFGKSMYASYCIENFKSLKWTTAETSEYCLENTSNIFKTHQHKTSALWVKDANRVASKGRV